MNDSRLELIMGRLLQAGVLVAALAMLAGGARYLALHGGDVANYRLFRGVASASGSELLWAGVLIMLATPVLRVAFAVCAFAMERDWVYVGVSLLVLALLGWALLGN